MKHIGEKVFLTITVILTSKEGLKNLLIMADTHNKKKREACASCVTCASCAKGKSEKTEESGDIDQKEGR